MEYQFKLIEGRVPVFKLTCNSKYAEEVLERVTKKTNLLIKLSAEKYVFMKHDFATVSAAMTSEIVDRKRDTDLSTVAETKIKIDVGVQTDAVATTKVPAGLKSKIPVRVVQQSKPPKAAPAKSPKPAATKAAKPAATKSSKPAAMKSSKPAATKSSQLAPTKSAKVKDPKQNAPTSRVPVRQNNLKCLKEKQATATALEENLPMPVNRRLTFVIRKHGKENVPAS